MSERIEFLDIDGKIGTEDTLNKAIERTQRAFLKQTMDNRKVDVNGEECVDPLRSIILKLNPLDGEDLIFLLPSNTKHSLKEGQENGIAIYEIQNNRAISVQQLKIYIEKISVTPEGLVVSYSLNKPENNI